MQKVLKNPICVGDYVRIIDDIWGLRGKIGLIEDINDVMYEVDVDGVIVTAYRKQIEKVKDDLQRI